MTRYQFLRVSGWGLIGAAVCLLLTFLPARAVPFGVEKAPFFIAILLITLGQLGLDLRQADRADPRARLAIRIGMAGGAAGLVSHVAWVLEMEQGRTLMNFALAIMFAGLFGFGVMTWPARLRPSGSGWAILAGLWWPLIMLSSYLYHRATGQWLSVPGWLSFAMFLGMSVGLAGLGYELQASARPHILDQQKGSPHV